MAADTAGDRPDLEAALLSEYWESVLRYADLCTISSQEAVQLTSEAFARALREAPPWSVPHFAWLPRLLVAVRNTAAEWQADGRACLLDPGLRAWFQADEAIPATATTALHGFQDMPEPDKSLLWHSDIELRPLGQSAAALGISPARAEEEIVRTRELFRESCLRLRLHTLNDKECRGYAKLLDVATRDLEGACPPDLRRHLAHCPSCATGADHFALHSGRLPLTLAEGVLGWGAAAYLALRREAAIGAPPAAPPTPHAARRRVGLTAAALAVPALVLLAILAPSSDAPTGTAASPAAPATAFPGLPAPAPSPSLSPSRSAPADVSKGPTHVTAAPSRSRIPSRSAAPTTSASRAPATCTAHYRVVNQWDGGFQAEVEVISRTALNGWRVEWRYPDGQHITQMWDGRFTQHGAEVTVTQADYNASIPARQPLVFGFLGTWPSANGSPAVLTLNGSACAG